MQAQWEKIKEATFENPDNPEIIQHSPFTSIHYKLGPDGRPILRVRKFLRNEEYIFPSQNDRVAIRKPGLLDPVDFLVRPFINKDRPPPSF